MPTIYYISAIIFFSGITNSLHIPPWNSFHSEFLCTAAIVLILIKQLLQKKILISKIVYPYLFFIFLFTSSIFSSNNPDYKNLVLYFSIYTAALFTGLNTKYIKSQCFYIFFILIGIVTFASLIIQFLSLQDYYPIVPGIENSRRAGGFLLQTNHSATFVCMGLICCLQKKFTAPFIKSLIFIILALGLAITESRTGALSFLVYAVVAYFKNLTKKRDLALSVIFIFLAYASIPNIYDKYYQNVSQSTVRANLEGGRLKTWPILVNAIAEKPFTGYGFNGVFNALDKQIKKNKKITTEPFHYAHNIILDLFIWFGIPIGITIITTIIFTIQKIQKERLYSTGVILIPIITHSFLEYPHAYTYFGSIFFFILGNCLKKEMHKIVKIKKFYAIILTSLLSFVFIYYTNSYLNSEELIRSIRFKSIKILSDTSEQKQKNTLEYFNLDNEIFNVKINKDISEKDLEKLKWMAQQRPSRTYQSKYTEALYVTEQCKLFELQVGGIEAYYGKSEKEKIIHNIQLKHPKAISCQP